MTVAPFQSNSLAYVLTTGAIRLTNAAFGAGTGAIVLDNVQCRATESNLIDCPANDIGINNCDHNEDAGVRCQAATTGSKIIQCYCNYYTYGSTYSRNGPNVPYMQYKMFTFIKLQ